MNYREELFKALTAGVDGAFRDKSIDALVEVCRAARKEGYESGRNSKYDYTKGLNDAWECVRKLNSEISGESIKSIFDAPYCEVFKKFTASEVIEKINHYEETKVEIKVGDEVTDNDGWKGVVTFIAPDGKYLVVTLQDGSALRWKKESFKKTGRHFPQIEEVLKQMKED